jgi:hypothetical protein
MRCTLLSLCFSQSHFHFQAISINICARRRTSLTHYTVHSIAHITIKEKHIRMWTLLYCLAKLISYKVENIIFMYIYNKKNAIFSQLFIKMSLFSIQTFIVAKELSLTNAYKFWLNIVLCGHLKCAYIMVMFSFNVV